jgi:hypothetical protein
VEPARLVDEAAIDVFVERHDGPASLELIRAWRAHEPEAFSAVRDHTGEVAGFFCLLGSEAMTGPSALSDPIVAQWRRHLNEHPVPAGQLVLGLRRWLDRERGELPCPVQAASWLDFKRTYMELRPKLRRIYAVVHDVALYWPIVERLGFRPLTAASGGSAARRGAAAPPGADRFGPVEVDGRAYTSDVLDFGPASVDGWLAGLVAAELGVDDPYLLDETAHELRADGQVIQLTPLEFSLFMCLRRSEGHAVSRARVLEEVWGTTFDGGSNVIEAVVAGLRRKLRSQRSIVETVRGVGYRLSVRQATDPPG